MWRFILVTFAFLGWSFYVLSGGTGYQPVERSLQAQAKIEPVRPVARPERVFVASLDDSTAAEGNTVARSLTTLTDIDLSRGDRVQVTLASVNATTAVDLADSVDPAKVQALTTPADEPATKVATDPILDFTQDHDRDLREVTGKVVNMRSGPGTSFGRVGKLRQGTEVEVLQDPGNGWVELLVTETGETGWMADWLVTAAVN